MAVRVPVRRAVAGRVPVRWRLYRVAGGARGGRRAVGGRVHLQSVVAGLVVRPLVARALHVPWRAQRVGDLLEPRAGAHELRDVRLVADEALDERLQARAERTDMYTRTIRPYT